MDINGVAAAQKPESNPPVRPQKEAKTQKPPDQQTLGAHEAKTNGVAVEISAKSSGVVERHGVTTGQTQQNGGTAVNQVLAGQIQGAKEESSDQAKEHGVAVEAVEEESQLRRAYSLDGGDLVVEIIDTDTNSVLKEIPSEDVRRIREAISKFQSVGNPHDGAAETETSDGSPTEIKGIDVTS